MTDATNLEALARQLCEAEGFDPDERVEAELLDRLTGAEQMSHRSGAGETHVRVARWMTYRSRAEQMVTAGRASD
jgi:hypothetical protein